MPRIRSFFSLQPASSAGASATTYVPLVVFARGLSFIRALLVAKILGDAGQREFGLYQPALELINWLVPLVMFGLGDVAERYAARFENEARLIPWIKRQCARVAATGITVALLLAAFSPWLAAAVFKLPSPARPGHYGPLLVVACAITILLLALYQYLNALLRGLRAYSAAAGMETISALLFLAFSILAAFFSSSIALVAAYAASVLIPTLIYLLALAAFRKKTPTIPITPPAPPTATPPATPARLNHFAAWSLVRLMLMMTFGALSVWSIAHLEIKDPHAATAGYSTPYRIAQLLGSIGTTLWASSYALAAKSWSHHQTRRARALFFRVGKWGSVLLAVAAIILLLARGFLAAIMPPAYAAPIQNLLPPLLAVFMWYALLAFAGTFCDLQERPQKNALLWAAAVLIQLALILTPLPLPSQEHVLYASAAGLAFALLILAPLILWHPFRFNATALPLVLLSLAPVSLFSPTWVVDYIAPPILLFALVFLLFTGTLFRRPDRRAFRRLLHRPLRP